MSQSLASAKRRRAPVQEAPVNNTYPSPPQPTPASSVGLTLPQVIQIVDKRLTILEKFMSEVKPNIMNYGEQGEEEEGEEVALTLTNVVEEFNQRYELLAEEIVNIKNIVLSLQSYTMDVNKMLLEERTIVQPFVDTNADADADADADK